MSKVKMNDPETQRIIETLKKVDMPGAKRDVILRHATILLYPKWRRTMVDRFSFISRFVQKRSDFPAPCYICGGEVRAKAHLVKLENGTYSVVCRKDYERLMELSEDYGRVAVTYHNIKTNNW